MKAFLLAAGNGTRLRPFTDTKPKCMLPIKGQPLLNIWLQLCQQCGITEVLINLHAHSQAVREYLSQFHDGPKLTLVEEPDLLGSAGTLAANRKWVAGEKLFWVFYADVLTNFDSAPMLRFHRSHNPAATIGVSYVPDPSRCGIVSVDDGHRVTHFVEKPTSPAGNLAFTGLLLGSGALLDEIPDCKPADLGHHVLPRLLGKMCAYEVNDFLLDIGTVENYQQAQVSWPGLRCK